MIGATKYIFFTTCTVYFYLIVFIECLSFIITLFSTPTAYQFSDYKLPSVSLFYVIKNWVVSILKSLQLRELLGNLLIVLWLNFTCNFMVWHMKHVYGSNIIIRNRIHCSIL